MVVKIDKAWANDSILAIDGLLESTDRELTDADNLIVSHRHVANLWSGAIAQVKDAVFQQQITIHGFCRAVFGAKAEAGCE